MLLLLKRKKAQSRGQWDARKNLLEYLLTVVNEEIKLNEKEMITRMYRIVVLIFKKISSAPPNCYD